MNKIMFGFVSFLMVSSLFAGQGKIRISSDQEGAYIYVDGKKKAMTGEGFTSILLESGEYTIKVSKPMDEKYEYTQSKKVFVGEDTSVKLIFKLTKQMTSKGKILQAKADAAKLARWERSGEVVTDTKIGLIWQDNAEAKSTVKKWESAKEYCQHLSMGGHSDWRLPTYNELLTIVDEDKKKPAIIVSFKNTGLGVYWSSSTNTSNLNLGGLINFYGGRGDYELKIYDGYVRCVRDR